MRTTSIAFPLLTGVVLLMGSSPRFASAEWPQFGRALCTDPNDQDRPKLATDGAGGAIVVWQDFRSAKVNVFARHVLVSGNVDPAWPINGRALLADSTALATASGGQQFPVIVPDGAGGAIVAWQDGRSLANGLDIFAQHVLASGAVDPAWPSNGRALAAAAGQQDIPKIVSDGKGGAIVTWMDGRPGASVVDIYAQHVLASGAVDPHWPVNGVAVSTAPAAQAFPNIVSDGLGGAIVTWYDFRSSISGLDIYAQHVTCLGTVDPVWPTGGRALCLAPGPQSEPTIVTDGVHGAIVTWIDARDGVQHIYAQRVLGSGAIAPGWPTDGRAVCTAPVAQITPILVPDGASGAIVTWRDGRNSNNDNPFAQHVLASGVIDAAWPVNGRALSLSSGEMLDAAIVEDGVGGAIIAWEEDSFILVNHIQASGLLDPKFPTNGLFVKLVLTFQQSPGLVTSGLGTAIVAWADGDTGLSHDIYAMIVVTADAVGVDPGVTPAVIEFAPPSPNPASGAISLRFALPRAASVSLAIYDIGGRRVRALASGVQPEGEHAIAWDLRDESGRAVGAGIYFVRLEVEDGVFTRTLVTLK